MASIIFSLKNWLKKSFDTRIDDPILCFVSIPFILLFSYMKKYLTLWLVVLLGGLFANASFAATPADVVSWAYTQGITRYSDTNSFGYDRTVSRQEAAAMASRFAGGALGKSANTCSTTYHDANQIDSTLHKSVMDACGFGIMNGANGYFSPTRSLTTAEALAVVIRAVDGKKYDESVDPWYFYYMIRARTLGLSIPSDNFDTPVTRGTYVSWMYALASQKSSSTKVNTPVTPTTPTTPTAPTTPTPTTGGG